MEDIIVRVIPMPGKIRGATVLDENGDYNIYLNDNLSPNQRQRTYEHELFHILNNDFFSGKARTDIEKNVPKELK